MNAQLLDLDRATDEQIAEYNAACDAVGAVMQAQSDERRKPGFKRGGGFMFDDYKKAVARRRRAEWCVMSTLELANRQATVIGDLRKFLELLTDDRADHRAAQRELDAATIYHAEIRDELARR